MIDWPKAERIASDTLGRLGVSLIRADRSARLRLPASRSSRLPRRWPATRGSSCSTNRPRPCRTASAGIFFRLIAALKAQGVGIIYISHHLAEVPLIGDRVTVLRDGRVAAHLTAEGRTERELAELMVGRNVGNLFPRAGARALASR